MEILNILRDPSWQFIGAIAAVFALGATFLVFIFQKSKKLLGFEIISITPLLTTKESFQGKLIINYDNRIVSNVIILILKIYNVGNVPITSKDYEEPLSIYLGQFTNILSAEIEDKIPENIKISIKLGRLGGKHFLEIYILFVYVAFHGICKRYKMGFEAQWNENVR